MARNIVLGLQAQKTIMDAVEALFERAKKRLLGPAFARATGGKQMVFSLKSQSLAGIFDDASAMEGVAPREEVKRALIKIAGSYVDAQKEKTKAKVLQNVQSFISNAQSLGNEVDVQTVLGGQLSQIWSEVSKDVRRIVETETTVARNTSIYDAIGRIGAAAGRQDPVVFFVVVRDKTLCEECRRLHLQPDGVTPRLWLMSELSSGYHKKGEDTPAVGGLHPHCRCVLTHLMPGFGFDGSGRVTYREPGWDELQNQRGSNET